MRQVAVVASALLALAACKKEQPAPTPAEEPTAQPAAPAAQVKEAAPAPAEEKIVLDEPAIEKYAAFQKDMLAAVREGMAKSNEAVKSADKDSTLSQTAAVAKVADAMNQMDQREKELLVKHGLSRRQMEETRQLVADVITSRMLLKTAGGTSKVIEAMRAGLKSMPADRKAEAEAEIAKMEKDFADMTNAADARKKYGDAAVEAVLKHEEELSALQAEALKSLGGK